MLSRALAFPISILLVEPSKLPPPSICPVAAAVDVTVPLTPLLVESFALRLVPFGKCHTPLKFASQTAVLPGGALGVSVISKLITG